MKLKTYLLETGLTSAEFARMVGASRSAVSRWVKDERRPTRYMPQILKTTDGKVTPSDFYEAA